MRIKDVVKEKYGQAALRVATGGVTVEMTDLAPLSGPWDSNSSSRRF